MSQYSHLVADLSNENSSATKIAHLVGRDRRVLDVGCAHGYLAGALRGQGCRVFGVERDAGDAERAREHCERVVEADLDVPGWSRDLADVRFESIVFSDVLEHLRDPASVLREALTLLDPAFGTVIASVPNVAHVSVRLELLLGSFRSEATGILDATHLHFFTRDSLQHLLAANGLEVEVWDCTTNEVADTVIEDYLRRASIPFTPELREKLSAFDAQAYQFVLRAKRASGPVRSFPPPPAKPLQYMARIMSEYDRLRTEAPELHREIATLRDRVRELEIVPQEISRRLREEPAAAEEELVRVVGELHRLRARPSDLARPRPHGLRVLQVAHQFLSRHTAGTEIYASDLSFALVRRGHAVRVFCGEPLRDDETTTTQWEGVNGITVERVSAPPDHPVLGFFNRFDNPAVRKKIGGMLDRVRPDVVHIQHLLYLSAQLIPECRNRGIPVVATLNDYWFMCHRVRLTKIDGSLCSGPNRGIDCVGCLNGTPKPLRTKFNVAALAATMYRYEYLRRQMMKLDRILVPSRFLGRMFAQNGIPADRITHCDYGTTPPSDEMAGLIAARKPHDRPRFGFLGSMMHHKGAHVLIDAFSRLPEGSAELHVFGPPYERQYDEGLRREAHHAGIRWRGQLAHAERWRALAEIDVLVVPSIWYENSPLTIHEALMVGVPVIGSDIGGIPELVEHGRTGLIFAVNDANALEKCLRAVVENPACIDRWRRAIRPPKTMDEHVLEIEEIYRNALSGERHVSPPGELDPPAVRG